ncbi:glycosyltransferase family 4 protein, partial [Mesorhizobium sp. M2D.F.Ca.ET.145.01.1.1]
VASMPDLLQLDRRRIRTVFERRFSDDRMARDYVAAYSRLTNGVEESRAS